jgi:PEP-CTERM motif-containing protein
MHFRTFAVFALTLAVFMAIPATAGPFLFNSGSPDGRMAMATRPDTGPGTEIEAADDFILPFKTVINHGTFTGLIPIGVPLSSVSSVDVEIYRVFPLDSVNPPSGMVPTRTNSPSDNAFDSRASGSNLTFSASLVNANFSAANSVLNGINKIPSQTTGGEGARTGQEVLVNVNFTTPFTLDPDHYFFVPQVHLTTGDFFWLSVARPIVGAGTTPFAPDLQAWIRNANLDPDWLRVGTDIVGGATPPTFNAAFTLDGTQTPEPGTLALFASGLALLYLRTRKRLL